MITYEKEIEPYAVARDTSIRNSLTGVKSKSDSKNDVKISSFCSHTLYEADHLLAVNKGVAPTTYQGFCKLFLSMGKPRLPIAAITAEQVRI